MISFRIPFLVAGIAHQGCRHPFPKMRLTRALPFTLVALTPLLASAAEWSGVSDFSLVPRYDSLGDTPPGCPECPACFNCQLNNDNCTHFAECNSFNGKCSCPPGFGGDDCSVPCVVRWPTATTDRNVLPTPVSASLAGRASTAMFATLIMHAML